MVKVYLATLYIANKLQLVIFVGYSGCFLKYLGTKYVDYLFIMMQHKCNRLHDFFAYRILI